MLHAALLALLLSCADDLRREGGPERRERLAALEGQEPPPLQTGAWLGAPVEGLALSALHGKVVLLDFWGSWSEPCRADLQRLSTLAAAHSARGLVVIGLHSTRDADALPAFVEAHGIDFPVAIDRGERSVASYLVDDFPDYYLIDRKGRLRVADLEAADLERALEALLAEEGPPAPEGIASDWPSARFDYLLGPEKIGTWELRHELVEAQGRARVRLFDRLVVEVAGRRVEYETDALCHPDGLFRPVLLRGRIRQGEGESEGFELAIEGGRLTWKLRGREDAVDVPADTTHDMALLRIASRMPFEPGIERSFTAFELEDGALRGRWKLACVGKETIEVRGRPQEAWLFERTAERKAPMQLWYSADRRLLMARWDDSKRLVPSAP